MENTLKQSFIQVGINGVPNRVISQYNNETGDDQVIVNYEDLTDKQKVIFDNFKQLSISIIV